MPESFFYEAKNLFQVYENLADLQPWNISHTQTALKMQFYTPSVRYQENNQFELFNGFRMIVHNADEFPSYSGYQVYHEKDHNEQVRIEPEIHLMDDDVKRMSIKKRECFLPNEKSLKYFKVYTKRNCEQECLSAMMAESCGCVPFYMISNENGLEIITAATVLNLF